MKKTGGVLKFKRRRAEGSRCECGRLLAGVKGTGAKSEKTVSRKYGGGLCPRCLRKLITMKAIGAG